MAAGLATPVPVPVAGETGGVLSGIAPGVLMDGDDIGRWLQRQEQPATWSQLSTEQQERLTVLSVKPLEAPSAATAAERVAVGGTGRDGPVGAARSAARRNR
ncbi:helicase associated domain-containing protein [Streptomyces sp. NPDC056580]|uniref:helicase associated domain-containing protein n=1 Tax=Streptomyces sp. NPDC056580 TaxID=3345872 RepID=UPI0036A47B77